MSIANIVMKLKRLLYGALKAAEQEGMRVESGVSCMRGVNFGSEPYLITLHKNCRISSNVIFVNHDGGTWAIKDTEYDNGKIIKFGVIEIGEGAFVGARSVIMPGVHVGAHSVIGAGSVVTKDIPPYTVACGVPARVVCTLEEYAAKCKKQVPGDFDFSEYQHRKKEYLIERYMK